jgi:hypothetical protein
MTDLNPAGITPAPPVQRPVAAADESCQRVPAAAAWLHHQSGRESYPIVGRVRTNFNPVPRSLPGLLSQGRFATVAVRNGLKYPQAHYNRGKLNMNLEKVFFAFFIVLALTLNFGFFIGELDDPNHHNIYELFAALVEYCWQPAW